jgi:predicted dehydrogenase
MPDSVDPATLRIAVVGVGGVARYAHLPAYRRRGLHVAALCDVDGELAHEVASEYQVDLALDDVRKLAERDDVDVVDIATPPGSHAELIEIFAAAGKPMLVQKPLCVNADDFHRIVRAHDRYGPWIRLNLTGRYVSAWQKVAELLAAGEVGSPFLCTIRNQDWWDRELGRWDHEVENYVVFEMLIHHLDLCRYWFGAPTQMTARAGTHPAQRIKQANWLSAMVEFAGPTLVQILEDWTMPEFSFSRGHPFEEILINGEHGVIRADSERVELSKPEKNTLYAWHLPRPGQTLLGEQLSIGWFPDSFGASMQDFLSQVATGEGRNTDWERLVELTNDTFTAASAVGADRWLPS